MAVKTLDEVLSSLSADEKKLFENTLSKNPELKEGWLRQDDYSRKQNELKAEREKMTDDLAYADRMKDWSERIMPRVESLRTAGILDDEDNEIWTTQKADLERQLDEAKKAALGGEMDPAELDKRVREIVKANGSLTKEELAALINSQAKQLAEETFKEQWAGKETDFNEKTIPFVAGFSAANTLAAIEYEKETGKQWTEETQKEFFELMAKEKEFNPYKVREKFLAPHKQAKTVETEKAEAIRLAVEEDRKNRSMPGGGEEKFIPGQEKGNLQKMLERSKEPADFESVIAAQAVKAAKELHAEGH